MFKFIYLTIIPIILGIIDHAGIAPDWRGTDTVVNALIDRKILPDNDHILDGLVDEDERDQGGKVLLGEAGYVADEGAGINRGQDDANAGDPHADPEPEGHIFPAHLQTELVDN